MLLSWIRSTASISGFMVITEKWQVAIPWSVSGAIPGPCQGMCMNDTTDPLVIFHVRFPLG